MSRPARWECERCRRLLAEIEQGRLRLARSVEVVYAVDGGLAICCPACDAPRVWTWQPPAAAVCASSAPAAGGT